jgi:hypothetical protein
MVHESTMIKRNPNLFLTGWFPLAQNLGIALVKFPCNTRKTSTETPGPLGQTDKAFSPWMKLREET